MQNVSKNWNQWQKLSTCSDPNHEKFPEPFHELDIFERLMVIKIFRPEKLLFGFSHYVESEIGKFYLEIPRIIMQEIY